MQQASGGKGWGRIINIASAHGLVASAEKSAYVASKHAIVGLTKVTALENAKSGVTCNAVCPGWMLTPLVQKQLDDRANAGNMTMEAATAHLLGEKEPSLKFITPEELGRWRCFSALRRATMCAAWRGKWMAAGWRSKAKYATCYLLHS